MKDTRLGRGQEIANKDNQINRIDENTYKVKSQSGNNEEYDLIETELDWLCSCADHMFRGVICKHIHAVEISLALRETVAKEIVIPQINANSCPQCQSQLIVRDGLRLNKYGDIQRYTCIDCFKRFTINLASSVSIRK
ncbi:MAG: hypothetical protein WCF23_04990 [Candidatus Nitrosopolaris sp.]